MKVVEIEHLLIIYYIKIGLTLKQTAPFGCTWGTN